MTGHRVTDAALKVTKALPASDDSVYTAGIDLGAVGARDDFIAPCELLMSAPVLTTGELPDADTATYVLQMDADALFSNPVNVYGVTGDMLVQTGSTGAAAQTKRVRLPSDVEQFVRMGVTTAGTSGDCSGKSMTLELLL